MNRSSLATRATVVAAALVLASSAGCGSPSDDSEPSGAVASPIVGGRASSAHPAVGILNIGNATTCSGVLIAPNLVLTAAHCFGDFYRRELENRPPVWFFTGDPGVTTPVRAARVVVHEGTECRFTKTSRDLAYLVLEAEVKGVEPLPIERAPHASHCEYVAVGYGRTTLLPNAGGGEGDGGTTPLCAAPEIRPPESPALLGGDPLRPAAERKALPTCADPGLTSSGYIASRGDAGSICVGDSGSPLIDERSKTIVGIASGGVISEAGVQCETGSLSVYTPVFDRLAFIDEGLAAAGAPPPDEGNASDEGCREASHPASGAGGSAWPASALSAVVVCVVLSLRRKRRRPRA